MTSHYGPFWNRTLKIFRLAPVRLRLTSGQEVIGDIDRIGDASCSVKKADGSLVVVQFDELRECLPAVPKL